MGTIAVAIATVSSIVVILDWFGIRPKTMTEKRPTIFVMAVLMIFTWAAVGFDYYDRHKATVGMQISAYDWDHYALKQVWSQSFSNQTVMLDGYEYTNCSFDNVTFEYEGRAPSRLTTSRINLHPGGRVSLESKNAAVTQTMILMSALSQISGGPVNNLTCAPAPNINP